VIDRSLPSESSGGLEKSAKDSPVVVVGTGAAGLRAALELKGAGVPVLVVSKGAAGASGATPSALFSYCAAVPEDPSNSISLFQSDVLRSGLGVNDPKLVEALCRDSYPRLQDLTRLGMPWTRSSSGEPALAWLPGHSVSRAFYADHRTGQALSNTLLSACVKAGIPFRQYHAVLDLLTDRGRVAGLVLLDWISGEAAVWPCNAVILACGGAAAIFRLHTNPPGQTGDGMALALRAGGELVDMEFMQMYPTVLVYPPAAFGHEVATGRLMAAGARLLNRHGEEFFHRWEKGPIGKATRDVLGRSIAREIAAGGGTDAGGVYLDANNVQEMMDSDRYVRFLQDLGVDPAHTQVQVAPGAHYSLGGVRVYPPASCCGIKGLFGAGELVGGVHGANRLAGNALTGTQVFGYLAAKEAIRYLRASSGRARRDRVPGSAPRPPGRGESSVWDFLCDARERTVGSSPEEMRPVLVDAVQKHGSFVRTRSGLEQALRAVDDLEGVFQHNLKLPPLREKWNPELLGAVELANMLSVARALLASAWARTESRGAHFREDSPEMDKEWDGHNLVVRGTGKGMAIFRHDRQADSRRQVWP